MSEPISRLNRPWTGGWNDPPMMGNKPKDRQSVVTRQLKPGSRYYPTCPHIGASVSQPEQFIGAPTSPHSVQGQYQYSMPQQQASTQPPLFSATIPAAYHAPQYYQPSDTSLVSADSGYQPNNTIPPHPPTSGMFQSSSFQLSPSAPISSLMPEPDEGPQYQYFGLQQHSQASQPTYQANFGAVPAIQVANPSVIQQSYCSPNQPWQPQKFQPMTNYPQHPLPQDHSPQEQPSPQQIYELQYQQYQQQYQEQYQQYQRYQQQYQAAQNSAQYTEPPTSIPQPLPQEPELIPPLTVHPEPELALPPGFMSSPQSSPTSQQTSPPMVPATETTTNPDQVINDDPFGLQQPFIQTTQPEPVSSECASVDQAEVHTQQSAQSIAKEPVAVPVPQPTSNNLLGLQEQELLELTPTASEQESEESSTDSITTEEPCPVMYNDPFGLQSIEPVLKSDDDLFGLQSMGGSEVSNDDPFGLQSALNIEAPIFTMFTPKEAAAPIEDLDIFKIDSNVKNDPFDLQQYTPTTLSPSNDSSKSDPFNLDTFKSSIAGLETFQKDQDSAPPISTFDNIMAPKLPIHDEPPTLNIDTDIIGGISIFKPDIVNIFKPVAPEPDNLFAPSSKPVVEDIDNGWDNDFNSWDDKETADPLFEEVQL